MDDESYSVTSVSRRLTETLHQYIEAQYHIWDESLLLERRRLLSTPGVTDQIPALEATPFYSQCPSYEDLKIPELAKHVLRQASSLGIGIFPQPFNHQYQALESFLGERRDIIVATGRRT